MADDVKRLNYFNHQFLRAKDFSDQQDYLLQTEREHSRLLHTPGIAEGLDVLDPAQGSTVITVSAGVAYDNLGRRIVLANNKTLDLAPVAQGQDAYVTITYAELPSDHSTESDTPGDTRMAEVPVVEFSTNQPSNSRTLILAICARGAGSITVDRSMRLHAGTRGGDLTVNTLTLSNDAVSSNLWSTVSLTKARLVHVEGDVEVNGQIGPGTTTKFGGPIDVTGNVIVSGTVDGRDVSADGIKLDQHTASVSNPHATTAAQIDVQGGTNRLVTQINAGTGVVADARIDPLIARTSRFDVTTGHDHDGSNARRIGAIDATHFASLSGAALTGLNGSQITTGTVVDARIDAAIARQTAVNNLLSTSTGHNHDGSNSRRLAPFSIYNSSGGLNTNSVNTGVSGGFVRINDFLQINKAYDNSFLELHLHTTAFSGTFGAGTGFVKFQLRVDSQVGQISTEPSVTQSGLTSFISGFAVFTGLAVGLHLIQVWVASFGGTSTGILLDSGGVGGRLVVKETL